MPLELLRVVTCNHDDLRHTCLVKGGDDTLGNGDGADIQHGLKIPHARRHARRYNDRADLHIITFQFIRIAII